MSENSKTSVSAVDAGPGPRAGSLPEAAGRGGKPKLLIFIVAYHAESTLENVLSRIPAQLAEDYEVEVLVIDDASTDRTFELGHDIRRKGTIPFPVTVLFNPVNQGYGGNQKIGFFYALKNGFDFVALVHGDGQYAPEALPDLVRPLKDGSADACFGSRMMTRGAAREGGMPLYKFVGNKILSWFENRMLRTAFTEFHSGYRIYAVEALRRVPFALNTRDFHFDTEIIIQFVTAGLRIVELPIPTYYGDEICRVNGMKYAFDVVRAVIKARIMELGLLYDRRFDCAPEHTGNAQYQAKLDYESPHSLALQEIDEGARVLDLGCAGGYVAASLKAAKECHVVGVDMFPLPEGIVLDGFRIHNLNDGFPDVDVAAFDVLLMLDVIEHLASPEEFVRQMRDALKMTPDKKLVVSTGNIAFFVTRFMLLLGQFNYGKRGTLDMTHTRLFTFASMRKLFEEAGFSVVKTHGVPGPFPLAFGPGRLGRFLVEMNKLLIRVSRGLFSYQIFMVVQANPSLEFLLQSAEKESVRRAAALDEARASAA